MYRDQGKVWIPQKSLIIEHNLAQLRKLYNGFLVEGEFKFESAERMLERNTISEEMVRSTIQSMFIKSILTPKIVQLPESERFLTFVEFISFVVRIVD